MLLNSYLLQEQQSLIDCNQSIGPQPCFLSFAHSSAQGTVDPCTGAVRLLFEAAMLAQLGSGPPVALPLQTCLTSEPAAAYGVQLEGERLRNGAVT